MTTTPSLCPGLTPEQVSAFRRDGFLVVPGALPAATVAALLAETRSLLASLPLADHPMTRFTTGGPSDADHVGDDYFLGSGDKIRFFFEDAAFDPTSGRLALPKERAVNKIGHCLHALSPPFALLLSDDGGDDGFVRVRPAALARCLGFRDPRCLQSMVICKQPGVGGAVPPHQDSTFLYTDPPSAVGFWYALEDATLGNGCLSFLPGSHRWAGVRRRLVRKVDAATGRAVGTEMVENEGPRFPPAQEEEEEGGKHDEDTRPAGVAEEQGYVPGEVKAGDLVLIHGNLLHKSERNLSDKGRIIYTFHVIEGDGTVYDQKNWLQPPEGGFTKLYTGLA